MPQVLGHGLRKANITVQAGLAFLMLLGALFAHPVGWYAAVTATIAQPVDAVVHYREFVSSDPTERFESLALTGLMLILLFLLLFTDARTAWGIGRPA